MYTKKQKIQSDRTELSNYIEDIDVYNSYLIQKLTDPTLEREKYEITVYEFRPDLIALDFYSDYKYMGLLLIQTRLTLDKFRRGVVLELIPKNIIDNIISNL